MMCWLRVSFPVSVYRDFMFMISLPRSCFCHSSTVLGRCSFGSSWWYGPVEAPSSPLPCCSICALCCHLRVGSWHCHNLAFLSRMHFVLQAWPAERRPGCCVHVHHVGNLLPSPAVPSHPANQAGSFGIAVPGLFVFLCSSAWAFCPPPLPVLASCACLAHVCMPYHMRPSARSFADHP